MHTSEMTDRARGAFTIVSNIFIPARFLPPHHTVESAPTTKTPLSDTN